MKLAKDVLKSAQLLKSQQAATLSSARSSDPKSMAEAAIRPANPFFAQLPTPLAQFFKRYPPAPFRNYADKPTLTNAEDANPFLANKHPITNRYSAPRYSLRQQSDLYKSAYRLGVSHLLPPLLNGKKLYEEKHESKVPVRGARAFKLTKGERTKEQRIEEVAAALKKADATIAEARGRAYERKLERRRQRANKPVWF